MLSAQLGDRLALAMQVEHAILLLHVWLVLVKLSIAASLSSASFVLIAKQASVRSDLPIQAISTAISHLIVIWLIGHHRCHRLLELRVAQATEHGQSEENQAKEEHKAKEGPLEFLSEDKGTKDVINLILRPCRLTPDIRQWIEVAKLRRDRNCMVLEEIIAEELHIEEDTLQSGQTDTGEGLNPKESVVVVIVRLDDVHVGVVNVRF